MEIFEGFIKALNKAKKRKRELDRGEVNADSTDTERQNIGKGREILNKSTKSNWANSLNKAGEKRRAGFKNQAKSYLNKSKLEKGPKLENTEMKLSEKVCMVIKQLGGKSKKKKVNEVYSRLLNILTEGNKANKALKNKREVSTGSKILRNEYDKGKATIPSTKQKDLEKRLARDTQRPNSTIDYGGRYKTYPKPFLKLDLEDKVKSPKPKLP